MGYDCQSAPVVPLQYLRVEIADDLLKSILARPEMVELRSHESLRRNPTIIHQPLISTGCSASSQQADQPGQDRADVHGQPSTFDGDVEEWERCDMAATAFKFYCYTRSNS